MSDDIEIVVGEVNDVEAHVYARYNVESDDARGGAEHIEMTGTLRGPYCETSRTLPAEFAFKSVGTALAEAVIPDPCQWSQELPHVYRAHIVAKQDGRIIGQYEGQIGLRRTTPRRSGIEFPG